MSQVWLWSGFGLIVVVLLALDLGVFHKDAHRVGAKEAAGWTALWIAISLAFTGVIYLVFEHGWFDQSLLDGRGHPVEGDGQGLTAATRYLTAYLLEKSLSIDNIFVIALVFQRFNVDPIHRHRVLFWGVFGAIVMRALMLFGGLWLLHRFDWLFYVFGAYLIYTGIKLFFPEKDVKEHAEEGGFTKRLKRWFRVAPPKTPNPEGHFFTRVNGNRVMTTLGLALLTVEWTDLVFALDSIPAVIAVAPEPFIVFTSNIFAIMGLRSLYFVLENAVEKFTELRYALAVILAYIGAKMFAHDWVHIPNWASLLLIVVSITVAVSISVVRRRREKKEEADPAASTHD